MPYQTKIFIGSENNHPNLPPIMEFKPPINIAITSDDSEVTFVRKEKELYVYKYTNGLEKVGTEVKWTQSEIEKQLTNYFKVV